MNRLLELVHATRPWSFSMTFISVTLGNLLALQAGFFRWSIYLLSLAGMVSVHGATNLINDYLDYRHGVDRPGSATTLYRRHPIISGAFKPRQILTASIALYAFAVAIGVALAVWRGWIIVIFIVVGVSASFFYTGGPVKYKHHALGELSVFLMWGPLMVLGTYFVQTAQFHGWIRLALVSAPQGLWVALVIFANNLKDIGYDRDTGVTTLANLLGQEKALARYLAILSAIYVLTGIEILTGLVPPWGLLVFLSLPVSLRLALSLRAGAQIPADADPRTAQSGMIFGLLLLLSFLLNHLTTTP